MNKSQWIALVAGFTLVIACFMPWIIIKNPELTLSGVDTEGTRFGKPGYIHFFLTAIIIIFTFVPKLWAKRTNIFLAALNLAWAIKNFIVLGGCEAGECPVKQTGLYLVLFASLVLLITAMLPNMKIPVSETVDDGDEEL